MTHLKKSTLSGLINNNVLIYYIVNILLNDAVIPTAHVYFFFSNALITNSTEARKTINKQMYEW